MKKLISICLALIVMVSIAACDGGKGGRLKELLREAEGNWYLHGNSRAEMLRISADGSYEKFAALEDGEDFGTLNLVETGKILALDKDATRPFSFNVNDDKHTRYASDGILDGVLHHYDGNYYPASISGDLREKFGGEYYADGDMDQDYYEVENGEWWFCRNDGSGIVSTDSGWLEYYGGDRQELRLLDSRGGLFATLSIVSETELADQTGGISYLLANALFSDYDDNFGGLGEETIGSDTYEYANNESSESNAFIKEFEFYYLNGDSDSISLYFFSDGTVDIDVPGENTLEAVYSVDGGVVTIAAGATDDVLTMTIEDNGETLVDGSGERYVLSE